MIVKFGVRNPALVNLIMICVILGGLVVYQLMPRDLIPSFRTNAISIDTFYPGVSPEEIDKLITAKIDDAVSELDGVDEVNGTSTEGFSKVVVQTRSSMSDEEVYNLLDEIRTYVEAVKSELPEDARDPVVTVVKPNIPVINVAVYGEVPELKLKEVAEDVQDALEKIDGVNKVTINGLREREVWIEIAPEMLEKHRLTIDTVRGAIARSQADLAAGTIKSERGEYLVRTVGERDRASELEQIIVTADALGGEIRLGDIASVTDTFADPVTIGRFNGEPSVLLMVSKNVDGDSIEIADSVYTTLNGMAKDIPPGMKVGTFWDTSVMVYTRLHTMLTQAAQALILVLATLCLFLSLRMAFFTALGIPISFLGGLMLLHFMGYNLNMITMFGFIIVLGLVVDDAIVVSENCFRIMEKGVSPRAAAVIGTRQMVLPVLAAVSTTVAAFLPLLMMGGVMGTFLSVVPVTVTLVLAVSLIEAYLILPSHIADWTPADYAERLARKRARSVGLFDKFLKVYERALSFCLRVRYVFLFFMVMLLAVAFAYSYYHIPTSFMHEFESDQFMVKFECPTNYKLEDTLEVTRTVEQVLLSLPKSEVTGVSTSIGVFGDDPYQMRIASNICMFYVDLVPLDKRRRNNAIYEEVRNGLSKIPEIVTHQVSSIGANPGGKAVELFIGGPSIPKLRELAEKAKAFLRKQNGTRDIQDDFVLGKRELIVTLNDRARSLGFDNLSVASQLRSAYSGVEAARIRPQGDDFPILVRYEPTLRSFRNSVEELWLANPTGARVRLVDVADISEVSGLRSVRRRNGNRTITVSSEVNEAEGNSNMINNALLKEINSEIAVNYPGYYAVQGGQAKEFKESIDSLGLSALLACLLILVILTAQFRSFPKSFIVMTPIPLCYIGVVVGHAVHGMDFAILSFFGMVALAGVVVNDSILLVDFINTARGEGLNPFDAALQSGRTRMRPVILTTVTTVCGLATLAFFAQGQVKFLSPMAVSIVWGIAFATVITLFVIPCLYLVYIDIRRLLGRSDDTEVVKDSIDAEVAKFMNTEGLVTESKSSS